MTKLDRGGNPVCERLQLSRRLCYCAGVWKTPCWETKIGVEMKRYLIASACAALAIIPHTAMGQATSSTDTSRNAPHDPAFERFVPAPNGRTTKIDYSFWNDALGYMVLRMGVSTRQGARKPDAGLGTKRVYGHDSRIRMEGNRVAFSFLDETTIAPISEYRRDLERIGSDVDLATLPRNEQLAYWINLHNVAIIEQIALNYPVTSPDRVYLGEAQTPLDVAPFITVAGVKMSPRDIRTKIVYPNWKDPKVFYGFFHGNIGGPSIQREAFTGENVVRILQDSADEFVNSLRGVESYGDNLLVSPVYAEAAPFYFPEMNADLRKHLAVYAGPEVSELLASKAGTKVNQVYDTIADLTGGEKEPTYSTIYTDDRVASSRIPSSVARLLGERYEKYETLRKEGKVGRVIVLPPTSADDPPAPSKEVE